MKAFRLGIAATAMSLCATTLHAQPSEWYAGGTYGWGYLDAPQTAHLSVLGTDAVRLVVGRRVNSHLSVEATHLNFGAEETFNSNGTPRTRMKQHGTGVNVQVGTPLSEQWRFDALAGMLYMSSEFHNYSSNLMPIGGSTVKSWQPAWGVSIKRALASAPVSVQIEYLRARVKYGTPLNATGVSSALSLGAVYHF